MLCGGSGWSIFMFSHCCCFLLRPDSDSAEFSPSTIYIFSYLCTEIKSLAPSRLQDELETVVSLQDDVRCALRLGWGIAATANILSEVNNRLGRSSRGGSLFSVATCSRFILLQFADCIHNT
jgi:hypothetical protein